VIFVDASAIVAILTEEPEAAVCIEAIEADVECFTSPIAIFEAALGICRKRHSSVLEAYEDVVQFLAIAGLRELAVEPIDAKAALDAFSRFGKGRGHPAQLNMGDCFAYALTARRGAGLLFKGSDFDTTDIRRAIGENTA
jgi:ribonuclease VapC